jgi:regulator of sigma E protease
MLDQPSIPFTLIAFIAVLGPLVFLHELGHYLIGRWCGIKADVFSIGFGREVLGWTDKRGTRWKVGWLPLGGYVQFAGDADGASTPHAPTADEPEGSFAAAALWKRSATVAAGPIANFIVAILILSGFAMAVGEVSTPPVADVVDPNSAAAVAGIRPGDRITSVDGRAVDQFTDIPMAIMHRPGEAMPVTLIRDGRTLTMSITPRLVAETDRFGNRVERAIFGIRATRVEVTPVAWYRAPVVGVEQAWSMTRQMAEVIWQLVTGNRSIKDLGGPLKIAQTSGQQATLGISAFVFFAAMISLNLGFVNLLPLPMLDGGHLVFHAAEAVRRRPVSMEVQAWAFRAGFAAIAVLMIVVTFNDLSSFGLWQRIAGLMG